MDNRDKELPLPQSPYGHLLHQDAAPGQEEQSKVLSSPECSSVQPSGQDAASPSGPMTGGQVVCPHTPNPEGGE